MFKAAKAVIRHKDSFFLQLRDNKDSILYSNCWAFFGGRLELDEEPESGLIREIIEELSFSPEGPKEFHRWYNSETDTEIFYFFIELNKEEKFNTINEGQTGKWFKKSELSLISIAPDVRAVISLI